jgi:Undecaprenyl-phosphate glucose phosphotransferase
MEMQRQFSTARTVSGTRSVRVTSNVLRSIGIVTDIACFIVAYLIARWIYSDGLYYYFDAQLYTTGAIIFSVNFFLIRISRDAYSAYRGLGDDMGSGTVMDFTVAFILTAFTIVRFGREPEFPQGLGMSFVGLSFLLLMVNRIAFRSLARQLALSGIVGQRVVVYGSDRAVTQKVLELLEIERLPHVKVIGFADDRRERVDTSAIGAWNYVGGLKDVVALAQNGELDQIILALPLVSQERLDIIVESLSAGAIDICVIPREFLVFRNRYRINYMGTLPVLNIWQLPVKDLQGLLKEVQDRFLALIGLIFLVPLLLLTALAIRIESRGPILFKQKRFGFNNQEINVLKFRSMYVDRQDESGAQRTTRDDPRVTRVGRIIRRLSIDELPQLFNVLRGEMSIVGPRPHATQMRVVGTYYHDAVRGYAARHRVKPGITGLAQVRGLRGEIDTMERAMKRVEYDIYYIENWSPFLDLRIIVETLFKLVWDRYAY